MIKFLPQGRAPTLEDIRKAALVNPIIKLALTSAIAGIITPTQALYSAILALADQNETLQEDLHKALKEQRVVYLRNSP